MPYQTDSLLQQLDEAWALLEDVWLQFSVQRKDGSRWAGGLSVLEDVQDFLEGTSTGIERG